MIRVGAFLAVVWRVVGDSVTGCPVCAGGELPKLTMRLRLAPLLGITGEL